MNNRDQREENRKLKRGGRRYMPWLGWIVGAIGALLLIGAVYESMAEASDAKKYPPPGQLVDVGGYRLHIKCTGTGSPTVVIDAGLGDWSTLWGFVQPEVAKVTRVCTYDRAGSGWSEAGPLPRDAAHFARELHTLLQNAHIPGPYVIVGHSLGGLTARVFAHEYASEVVGVVLIESMSPQQFSQQPTGAQSQLYYKPGPFSFIQPALARFGVVRMLVKPLGLIPHLPANAQEAYLSRLARPSNLQATTYDAQGMPAGGTEAAGVKSFGNLPLIVLTARQHTDTPGWQAWQTEMLQLSTNSQQLFAEKSGHNIEIEEPEAAVAAIIQMVSEVR
jgi:pimeloyl-ACP methyl ester carboxylesterase